jgi:hypothetical protein
MLEEGRQDSGSVDVFPPPALNCAWSGSESPFEIPVPVKFQLRVLAPRSTEQKVL